MKKIRDVVCYYAPYDNMHTGNSSYAGKVILKEDDTFEGLVKDYRQEELYLVFGHMDQDEIEFVQTTKMDKRLPKVYRVKKDLGMESRFLLAKMSKEKNKVYTKKTQK